MAVAIGAGAVLINTAYHLLTRMVGPTIGLYRTTLLAGERFGVGRSREQCLVRHGTSRSPIWSRTWAEPSVLKRPGVALKVFCRNGFDDGVGGPGGDHPVRVQPGFA
jgi:hypothetical protein